MPRNLLKAAAVALSLAAAGTGARGEPLGERLSGLSEKQIDKVVEFMVGNALFFLFHETGHMLVSEFELPVLGKEEDAVDTLSSLLLLEAEDKIFDQALMVAIGQAPSAERAESPEIIAALGVGIIRSPHHGGGRPPGDEQRHRAIDAIKQPEHQRRRSEGDEVPHRILT